MPNSATSTMTVPPSATSAPSGQPQRQSCDRCHRQKLRCIRKKKTNGNDCDRCLAKGTQCVYSVSLPKGRPSLHRLLNEESNSPKTAAAGNTESARASPISRKPPASKAHQPPLSSELASTPAAPMVTMDTSMDMGMSMSAWPWLDTPTWDESQLDMGWTNPLNFSHPSVEDMLAITSTFEGDGNVSDGFDAFTISQPPSPPNTAHPRAYARSQLGNYDIPDTGTIRSNSVASSVPTTQMFTDKNTSTGIAQLSQLSAHLSALRSSCYSVAQAAADLSSPHSTPPHQRVPLIDSAAFEAVAGWLAYYEQSAHDPSSFLLPPDFSTFFPSNPSSGHVTPQHGGGNTSTILRDVFSSSHRLMEILRTLHTVDDILRHLVMACEAMLLEIYVAILSALQHEAYPNHYHSLDGVGSALGNVRLVLVVQLCAYLVERQHQVVDQCLAPSHHPNGTQSLPNSLPPSPFNPHPSTEKSADRESLKVLKAQVQLKLNHLRMILRCA